MKAITIILLLVSPIVGYSQQNAEQISKGVAKVDSFGRVGPLATDGTPTFVLSGEEGVMQKIPVESVDMGYTVAAYASGTTYNLTASFATINFSTADPIITLTEPGTYLLLSSVNLKYNAATYSTTEFASFIIRRSNNTPANLSNSDRTITLRIINTVTDHAGTVTMPPLIYATEASGDILELQGKLTGIPSAGSVTVTSAEIIAIRIL